MITIFRYQEIKDYNFKSPVFSEKTGHFTQLLWKDSTEIGCARSVLENKKLVAKYEVYIVCIYRPPGNTKKLYKDKVIAAKTVFNGFDKDLRDIIDVKVNDVKDLKDSVVSRVKDHLPINIL